jgi:hypothetical protein
MSVWVETNGTFHLVSIQGFFEGVNVVVIFKPNKFNPTVSKGKKSAHPATSRVIIF